MDAMKMNVTDLNYIRIALSRALDTDDLSFDDRCALDDLWYRVDVWLDKHEVCGHGE